NAVWFITGCSSGIGQALCEHVLKNTTSRVVATARNPSSLSSLPDGANVFKLALDVTSDQSIDAALKAALERFGRIDVVVNNAGYSVRGDTEILPIAQARGVMEVNFWGAVRVTRAVLPILRDTNAATGTSGGLIIQITSIGGRLAFAGNTFYHASKFALEGFTEGLAREIPDEWGIRFLCVEPGGVKTRYAETAVSSFDTTNRLEVYKDASMPTNQLLAYLGSDTATRNWAEPEKVVEVVYSFVAKGEVGRRWGLRLPLGSDSFGMQKAAYEQGLGEL
ncbi:NAD(P)-binding protein, partial [Bimuria novae-zelandiae CBS 107.79]